MREAAAESAAVDPATPGEALPKSPGFGFAGLQNIRPRKPTAVPEDTEIADAVGQSMGFHSREVVLLAPKAVPERPKKIRLRDEGDPATDQFNMRGYTVDINKFILYCQRQKRSYKDVFAELVAGLPD